MDFREDQYEERIRSALGAREERSRLRSVILSILAFVLLAFVVIYSTKAWGQSLVVATGALDGDRMWQRTVMLAAPVRGFGHIGVILNRPAPMTMARAFPDHAPSAAINDFIFMGGPVATDALHAIVRGPRPEGRAVPMGPDLWLLANADDIDRVIETRPRDARFYAGVVIWRPGELAEEVRKGMMVERPLDVEKIFRPDTSTLWEELAPMPGEKPKVES